MTPARGERSILAAGQYLETLYKASAHQGVY